MSQPEVLSQPFELGFTYTRSTGPVVGRFLTGLRNRRILGNRSSDGRVIVPPMEYDPDTAEPLTEFVEVSEEGELVSWCWVKAPRASHPMATPFAWAMIKLDGADIPMVHLPIFQYFHSSVSIISIFHHASASIFDIPTVPLH